MRARRLVTALAALFAAAPALAAEGPSIAAQQWSFQGLFGTFDRAAVQRGFQVYAEVCSRCHALKHVHYRDLHALGFSEDEVKAIASQFEVTDGPNDEGQMFQRKGRPSDQFAAPFANDKAARAANNGALPPDLSLMVKARAHGADYVYAVLAGYGDPPAGFSVVEGMSYNKAFPGNQIAMPPILVADAVTFADGSKASVEQMAMDVANFLAWTAEPELEARKRMGWKVILFMLVFTPMLYAVKRRIWSALH